MLGNFNIEELLVIAGLAYGVYVALKNGDKIAAVAIGLPGVWMLGKAATDTETFEGVDPATPTFSISNLNAEELIVVGGIGFGVYRLFKIDKIAAIVVAIAGFMLLAEAGGDPATF